MHSLCVPCLLLWLEQLLAFQSSKHIASSFLLILVALPTLAAGYDVVILNGRTMHPATNFDAGRNVGVKNGIIVTINKY